MKRIGLFLLVVVMVAMLAGCSSGDKSNPTEPTPTSPTGSVEDITGKWRIVVSGVDTLIVTITQGADGNLSGYEDKLGGYSVITGRLTDSSAHTYYIKEVVRDPAGEILWLYNMWVTLRGGTFDGLCDYADHYGNLYRDKASNGTRI